MPRLSEFPEKNATTPCAQKSAATQMSQYGRLRSPISRPPRVGKKYLPLSAATGRSPNLPPKCERYFSIRGLPKWQGAGRPQPLSATYRHRRLPATGRPVAPPTDRSGAEVQAPGGGRGVCLNPLPSFQSPEREYGFPPKRFTKNRNGEIFLFRMPETRSLGVKLLVTFVQTHRQLRPPPRKDSAGVRKYEPFRHARLAKAEGRGEP